MRRTSFAAMLAVAACLTFTSSAFAWSGAQWEKNTCGADLVSPRFNGNWWIRVSDESGTLAESSTIPAQLYTSARPLTVGGWSKDAGFHIVSYEAANAADHTDGYIKYTQPQWNCSPGTSTPGPPGPAGPAGPPGPKGDPGPPGPPVLVPQTTCTSKRIYRFLVRKRYVDGHTIQNVRAKDPDAKMTVKRLTSGKNKGRLQVTADYRGKKFTAFTHQRHIEVNALVATRGWLVLNENVDLCRPRNGKQNAPSASSDARPDASSSNAARVGAVASETPNV